MCIQFEHVFFAFRDIGHIWLSIKIIQKLDLTETVSSQICSWNQAVLSNECKVSCLRKQQLAPDGILNQCEKRFLESDVLIYLVGFEVILICQGHMVTFQLYWWRKTSGATPGIVAVT
jgi:hypothetical protein